MRPTTSSGRSPAYHGKRLEPKCGMHCGWRMLAAALVLFTSCQTTRQAKIVTLAATGVALLGGYVEYEARSDGLSVRDNIPITFGFAGAVALVSFASIFWLDDIPLDDDDRWHPSDYLHGSELVAGIQRTGCLGDCPSYTLALYRDGTVEFVGRRYVKVCGKAVGRIPPARVTELERQLVDAHVMAMDRVYSNHSVTDASSAYLWVRPRGGDTRGIAHYLGDVSAPGALRRAERAVDSAGNVEQWIGDRAQVRPGHLCK